MSYSLIVEGLEGAQRVRQGRLPSRGEWLNLAIDGRVWWLPVQEVAHVLSPGEPSEEPDHGCHTIHERAHGLVLTSLALGIPADLVGEEDAYKLILPPARWPLGSATKATWRNRNGRGSGPRGEGGLER